VLARVESPEALKLEVVILFEERLVVVALVAFKSTIVPEAEVRSAILALEIVVVASVEVPVTVKRFVTVASVAVKLLINAVAALKSVAKRLLELALVRFE
jgi:hypothetical protein